MTKASACLLLIVLALVAVPASAQAPASAQKPGRFYVGAGAGGVHSMDYCGPFFDTVVVSCDNTSSGYKVFGGIQILDFLAVEAGYADLGKFTSDLQIFGIPVSDATSIRGPLLEAVVSLPLFEGFSLLGKAGGIYWSIDQDFVVAGTPVSQTTSGVDMMLGFGAQYYFNRHFGLRAEYEYFPNLGSASQSGDTDLSFYSLSVLFRF